MTGDERKKSRPVESVPPVFAPKNSALAKLDMSSIRDDLEAEEKFREEMKNGFAIFSEEAKRGFGRTSPQELLEFEANLRKLLEKHRVFRKSVHKLRPEVVVEDPNPKATEAWIRRIVEMRRKGIQFSDAELNHMQEADEHITESLIQLERKLPQFVEKSLLVLQLQDQQIELLKLESQNLETLRKLGECRLTWKRINELLADCKPGLAVLEERLNRPIIKAPSPEREKWRFVAA